MVKKSFEINLLKIYAVEIFHHSYMVNEKSILLLQDGTFDISSPPYNYLCTQLLSVEICKPMFGENYS